MSAGPGPDYAGDVDWYALSVTSPGRLVLWLEPPPGGGNWLSYPGVRLELYNADGTSGHASTVAGTSENPVNPAELDLWFATAEVGEYRVQVVPSVVDFYKSAWSDQPYTLTATFIPTVGPATELAVVPGGGQLVAVSATLPAPLTVRVRDTYSNPVPNVTVAFSVISAPAGSTGYDLDPGLAGEQVSSSAITNGSGQASATLRLGNKSGPYTVRATVTGLPAVTFIAVATSSAYIAAVVADSPRAYWRLNEVSGTNGADSTGNGNDATYLNGVTLAVPHPLQDESGNTAVQLDGVNDYVRANDSASLSPTAAVSVEAWVKLTAYSGSYPRILSKSGAYELTLYTYAGSEGRLEWKVTLAGGDVVLVTAVADRLLLNQWYHVTATYDGTALKLFVNGVPKASKVASGAIKDSTSALTLGMNAATRFPAVAFDEVAVYGTAMAQARVQAHFEAAVPPVLTRRMWPQSRPTPRVGTGG